MTRPALSMATLDRRQFLAAGAASMGAGLAPSWAAAEPGPGSAGSPRAVILLLLVGGPSGHETFDPKPDAPDGVRGLFGTIATRLPGVRLGEHLPRLADRLDRVTMVRTLYHDAAPIHETGLQLLQTGRLWRPDEPLAHLGTLLPTGGDAVPPFVVLPRPLCFNGVMIPSGQEPGPFGGPAFPSSEGSPVPALRRALDLSREPAGLRREYGSNRFGRDCLAARRLVEAGTRFVAVNAADSVFNEPSFDAHGAAPFSTFEDYARLLLPRFDRAYAALLDDLAARGLLETTLVVAAGEMGRTPRLNSRGGRDHWPRVASAILAGGGMEGGRVIGATDAQGGEPVEAPIPYARLAATMQRALGLSAESLLARGFDPAVLPPSDARPIV